MPIGSDTFVTHGRLPHLAKRDKTYFVTFCTFRRRILPPAARSIVVNDCKAAHEKLCWFDIVTVMPDHVHVLVTPFDEFPVMKLIGQIKGRTARIINQLLGRSGRLWQRDPFDRIVRNHENRLEKANYIRNNPVRAGIVSDPDDYPWTWNPATAR